MKNKSIFRIILKILKESFKKHSVLESGNYLIIHDGEWDVDIVRVSRVTFFGFYYKSVHRSKNRFLFIPSYNRIESCSKDFFINRLIKESHRRYKEGDYIIDGGDINKYSLGYARYSYEDDILKRCAAIDNPKYEWEEMEGWIKLYEKGIWSKIKK